MIDLKTLFQKHPDCISNENRFRALMNELYPNERAKTNVLATILSTGIGREIQNGKSDYLSLSNFAKWLENEYGFASDLCEKCLQLWPTADGFADSNNLTVAHGGIITFGRYPQSAYGEPAPIEWLILDEKDRKAFIISKILLTIKPYHDPPGYSVSTTWEACSLRKWLNNDFLNCAFSAEEQRKIQSTTVTADKNPSYRISPGKKTNDKVFLLSILEANKYFSSDEARKCEGWFVNEARWWLRSPGMQSSNAAYVNRDGSVEYYGYNVDYSKAVRPAMWISLD